MKIIFRQCYSIFIVLFLINGIFLNCNKDKIIYKENYDYLLKKPIGLIVENTESENEVRIYYGGIIKSNKEYFFTNSNKKVKVSLDNEKLKSAKEITSKMKGEMQSFKNCKYAIWMKMGNINESENDLKSTGLNWK